MEDKNQSINAQASESGETTVKSNNLVVQKSVPLLSLWKSDFSLAEFKLLDAYMARINSHDPSRRDVVFEKGELEQLLGLQQIRVEDLKIRLANLMTSVELKDADKSNNNRVHFVTLFEESYATQTENGQWYVKMTCTNAAQKYFFNVENLGYLRYKLRSVVSITSRYTYLLFIYLESNRFRGSWTESLDKLKTILGCADDTIYSEYKYFNNRILQKCQAELKTKTICSFDYEPIREGRRVTSLKFTLYGLRSLETDPTEPYMLPDFLPPSTEKEVESKQHNILIFEELEESFTDQEIDEILLHVLEVPIEKLPVDNTGIEDFFESIRYRRYLYVSQLHARFKRYNGKGRIKSKANYFIKLINESIKN